MKVIKRILYLIVALLIACCVGILVCALNPSLTGSLADKVQQLTGMDVNKQPESDGVDRPEQNEGVYVPPEDSSQNVPDSVSGLTGLRPVTGENQQIGQEEADNLSSILVPGETGEDISFSAEIYPYYAMLDNTLQQLYRQVYANAKELNMSFVPVTAVTAEQMTNVVEAVYNDHPELFWLDCQFSCKYLNTGICVQVTLKYNNTVNDLETAKEDFQACTRELLSGAWELDNDYAKEQYVHDALVQIVEYDMAAPMSQSPYGTIVQGRSVCAGYARAFQYLMQQLGIPCYYCTGYAGGDHGWNIIKQGGRYYNVDVTWDDTEPSTYDYYNKSDRDFADTHRRTGLSVYLPVCEAVTVAENTAPESMVDDHINPNPQEPLRWHSRGDWDVPAEDDGLSEEEKKQENLNKAGITEEDVLETLTEYYEDCEKQLKEAGTGYKEFDNVIPESLWSAIERAYSSGSYRTGYVNAALKEMKAEEFAIQLQVQRLGGGYCRLYHNVYTD